MFNRLLIANRGEIAIRIAHTAKKMGIETVSVFTLPDLNALHPTKTDLTFQIDNYLDYKNIIQIAKDNKVEAIHPGYGFLSENAHFAQLCQEEGIIFVGPPVDAIRAMGSKSISKEIMEQAGVKTTPGVYHSKDDQLFKAASDIGYPVMLKAVMGGGGKGMRIVCHPDEFYEKLASCKSEAKTSFGDDRVLVEKYIINPRHIEFQIFGDNDGNLVHLFERDCSIQRRHQKILEESPAPNFSNQLRQKMADQALLAAKAVNYVGAGTVEFMLDSSKEFYFMEMNTRLQVEHPVTEMITGLDLVEWQLKVAFGEKLPLKQEQIKQICHAIEARIYAEDPSNDFLPSPGVCQSLNFPESARVDSAFVQGDTISPLYDPMIAKIITSGETRTESISNLTKALDETKIEGQHLKTNLDFLANLSEHPDFLKGEVHTGFLDDNKITFKRDYPEDDYAWSAFKLLKSSGVKPSCQNKVYGHRQQINFINQVVYLENDNIFVNNKKYKIVSHGLLTDDGQLLQRGKIISVDQKEYYSTHNNKNQQNKMPMPGIVKKIYLKINQEIKKGDPIATIEAMKMEHKITAEEDGIITEIYMQQDKFMNVGQKLIEVKSLD